MKNYHSNEISDLLYHKQMSLYLKIHTLIEKTFDDIEPETLNALIRTSSELEEKINNYKKELKQREMFSNNYIKNPKENSLEELI